MTTEFLPAFARQYDSHLKQLKLKGLQPVLIHYVRVHMANLHKRLEAGPVRPRHLLTEAGIGYRFVE